MVVLVGYLGIALIVLLSIAGPLFAGRWLADRDEPDPELELIEAHALMLLAGERRD